MLTRREFLHASGATAFEGTISSQTVKFRRPFRLWAFGDAHIFICRYSV